MGFMNFFRYLYESRLSDLFTDLRYKLLISSTPVSSVNETGVTYICQMTSAFETLSRILQFVLYNI